MTTLSDCKTQDDVLAVAGEHEEFDLVGFVMAYEDGGLSFDEIVKGFQHLVDTGTAWNLQGSYGRTAAAMIEQGYVTRK